MNDHYFVGLVYGGVWLIFGWGSFAVVMWNRGRRKKIKIDQK